MSEATSLKITLAAARVNAKLSQKAAAKQMKISNATLSKWERGESFPSVLQAALLCKMYGVPMDAVDFLPECPLLANNPS